MMTRILCTLKSPLKFDEQALLALLKWHQAYMLRPEIQADLDFPKCGGAHGVNYDDVPSSNVLGTQQGWFEIICSERSNGKYPTWERWVLLIELWNKSSTVERYIYI
jgi:hypothetical protein